MNPVQGRAWLILLAFGLILLFLAGFGLWRQEERLNALELRSASEVGNLSAYYNSSLFAISDKYNASLRMLNISNHRGLITGRYWYRGYYCVLTKNRTLEQIAIDDVHESCHALAAVDYAHFCARR